MSEGRPDPGSAGGIPRRGEGVLLAQAKSIFVELRPLGLAPREEILMRRCGDDAELRALVLTLLAGSDAPLPFESLADDIVAAREMMVLTQSRAQEALKAPAITRSDPGSDGGDRIGNYRLLERLGEGGFGVVFMAEQERPVRRRVALKIIKLGMDTTQVVARFEAERQALAMMDHPCIARVFDAGATETGRPYFVMELVRGSPITDYCDRRRLGIRERLQLVARVCDALQHAHQKGVIHRDIKPSNVLVTESAGEPAPKIIDFGIVKATGARLSEKTVFTEFRQMIGTPEYMSPEQAGDASEAVDTRTDVYAAGVLLYELLTGATPFDSRRLRSAAYGEMQRIIREEDPPKPSTKLTKHPETLDAVAGSRAIAPGKLTSLVRGELDWIVMKALEKDRSRRYDSAGSMGRDIQRYLGGEAVHAVPSSTGYRLRKLVCRNKGAVIAGSLVTLALVAGLVGTSLGFIKAVAERRLADAKTGEARASAAVAARSAYSANLLSACSAMALNQFTQARDFLDAAPESLRGWEWKTLVSRLDTSVRVLPCRGPEWKPGANDTVDEVIALPDGRSFLTVRRRDADAVQQWDLATGRLHAHLAHPAAGQAGVLPPASFVVSPDGSRLWGYSSKSERSLALTVSAWDLRTGERSFHADLPPAGDADGVLGMSDDGARILRRRASTVWVQDVATGSILATAHDLPFGSGYRLSNDGALLAVGDGRDMITLLDGRTLATIASLGGHRNIIQAMDVSSDNRWLASASLDGTARVWDLNAMPSTSIVLEHPSAVENVRFSPDASIVATSCRDGATRIWDARTGALHGVYAGVHPRDSNLLFLPDGRTIAGREPGGAVRFWDVTAAATVNIQGHKGFLNAAYLAEQPRLIVSAGWDGWKGEPGCVRLWDADSGEPVASMGERGEVAYDLAVSPDGRFAVAVLARTDSPWTPPNEVSRNRLELIDLARGNVTSVRAPYRGPNQTPRYAGLSFDPTGDHFATGFASHFEVRRSHDASIVRSRELTTGDNWIIRSAWSPDARLIACIEAPHGLTSGDLLLLDAATLQTVREIRGFRACAVAFSPDGGLCVASSDGTVRLYGADSGEPLHTLAGHAQYISSVAFSPDGARLATVGGYEGDIVLWSTATLDRVARFHEDDFVASVAWSADGSRLIGACGNTIRLWDDTPLSKRVEARDARRAALTRVEPIVAGLFDQFHDTAKVLERINADASLDAPCRKAALQELLRHGLQTLPPN